MSTSAPKRLPGLQGTATGAGVSALLYLPIVLTLALSRRLAPGPLLYAMAAGVLSSVVPCAFDLTALRSVPARFFGICMSVNPVLAALAGVTILHQVPAPHEVVGIVILVVADVIAVGTIRPPRHVIPPHPASTSPV